MASLTGQQIDQTYQGLIKTSANAAVSFPPASLEDGAGNTIGIKLGDGTGIGAGLITQIEGNPGAPGTPSISVDGNAVTIVKLGSLSADGGNTAIIGGGGGTGTFDLFDGTFTFGNAFTTTNVDFTNATVTGLPGGAAGLENGTGTDSLQSAAALTTTPATATGARSIALGEDADAQVDNSIALGNSTRAYGNAASIAIGDDADGHNGGVGIGDGAKAYYGSVAIGKGTNSQFTTFGSILIGDGTAMSTGGNGANILIGRGVTQSGNAEYATVIGDSLNATTNRIVSIGVGSQARGLSDVVIGDGANSKVDTSFGENVVIGHDAAQTGGEYSIAIGRNVTANGSSAIVIGNVAADGGSNSCVLIGNQATTNGSDEQIVIGLQASGTANAGGIAIGRQVSNSGLNATAIGRSASASNNAIGLGYQTVASGNESVALGYSADATAAGAVALGDRALANIGNAVAIGSQVTSLWGNGTTVNQLAVANYASLNFADDSAASTGGVPLGGIYHTSGALKIRTT
jgi:hypothetical protein